MKKLISSVSILFIILLLLPLVASAASLLQKGPEEDFIFEDYFEYVKTFKYVGPGGKVVIPSAAKGIVEENGVAVEKKKFVISVGQCTFSGCDTVTSVEIPFEVTWIGTSAFSCCESLESVLFDYNLESISGDAFFGCVSLKTVDLPQFVTYIGERSFYMCSSLRRVTSRGGLETIDKWSFKDCYSLESITLPDTLKKVCDSAFSGCESLKKVYYTGSEEDWNKITIEKGNEALKDAEIVFGYELPSFKDVKTNAYYCDPVLWAVENGITKGTGKKSFSPEEVCSRAQIVSFLWRAAGSPEPKSNNCPFGDVDKSEYYYDAVLWAVENKITEGTGKTTFSPGEPCTRGQIVTFLWRADGSLEPKGSNCPFGDLQKDRYYYSAVIWASENGITAGTSDNAFSPSVACTRGQVVTFLHRDHFKDVIHKPSGEPDDGEVFDIAFFGDSFTGTPRQSDHFAALAEGNHKVNSYDMTHGGWTLAAHRDYWNSIIGFENSRAFVGKWDAIVLNEMVTTLPLISNTDYPEMIDLFGHDKQYYSISLTSLTKTEEGMEITGPYQTDSQHTYKYKSYQGISRSGDNAGEPAMRWGLTNESIFSVLKEMRDFYGIKAIAINDIDYDMSLGLRFDDFYGEDRYHPDVLTGYLETLALYCTIFNEPAVGQNRGILTDDDIPGDTPEEKDAFILMLQNLVQEQLDMQRID